MRSAMHFIMITMNDYDNNKNQSNLAESGTASLCLYSPGGSTGLKIWPQFAIACFSRAPDSNFPFQRPHLAQRVTGPHKCRPYLLQCTWHLSVKWFKQRTRICDRHVDGQTHDGMKKWTKSLVLQQRLRLIGIFLLSIGELWWIPWVLRWQRGSQVGYLQTLTRVHRA